MLKLCGGLLCVHTSNKKLHWPTTKEKEHSSILCTTVPKSKKHLYIKMQSKRSLYFGYRVVVYLRYTPPPFTFTQCGLGVCSFFGGLACCDGVSPEHRLHLGQPSVPQEMRHGLRVHVRVYQHVQPIKRWEWVRSAIAEPYDCGAIGTKKRSDLAAPGMIYYLPAFNG